MCSMLSQFLRRLLGRDAYEEGKAFLRLRLLRWLEGEALVWVAEKIKEAGLADEHATRVAAVIVARIAREVES